MINQLKKKYYFQLDYCIPIHVVNRSQPQRAEKEPAGLQTF